MVRATTKIGGPAMAGGLIQALTAPVAILVDAISFALSAVLPGPDPANQEPKPVRQPDAHLGREIWEGLRFVLSNRLLRSIAGCTGSFNLFWSAAMAMLIVYLARDLSLSPGMVVFTVGSIGGIFGAFLVKPVVRWLGQGPAIWISTAVSTPFALAVPLARPGWSVWAAAACFSVVSIGVVVYNVTQVSFRQGLTPGATARPDERDHAIPRLGHDAPGAVCSVVCSASWLARATAFIGIGAACLAFLAGDRLHFGRCAS